MATGKPPLAGYGALAYTVVIVYASLQPFAGWRMPPGQVLGFLTAPWPRYITAADIALNVAAYLPLGTMLFVALRPPLRGAGAVRGNALGICGLILIALWILVQFHPAPLALGSGDLREALGLPPLFAYTPQSYLRAEAGVAAFAVMGISLLVSVLMRPQ